MNGSIFMTPILKHKKKIWPGSTQLAPVPPVLVGCGGTKEIRPNLITVAWTGIACSDPPMLTIAVKPERFSYSLIRENGVFSVNIPTAQLAPAVDWCGVVSGRDHDKFAERHLTPMQSSKITAPIVAECPLSLECVVKEVLELGAHHLFLAEIVAVQVSEHFLDEKGALHLDKKGLLAFAHGHYYELGRCIGHFGFSVRRKSGSPIRNG